MQLTDAFLKALECSFAYYLIKNLTVVIIVIIIIIIIVSHCAKLRRVNSAMVKAVGEEQPVL